MDVSTRYAFLLGSSVLLVVWTLLFADRKDLRKEMVIMSLMIGILSVATGYYWWTADWWSPPTVTGTRIGIEDFLIGFASGGIMAIVYEVIFKKRLYKRKPEHHYPGAFTILLLLANITAYLFWGIGLTSFYASSIALAVTFLFMLHYRKDLLLNGILTGVLMVAISLVFYYSIFLFSPGWFDATYLKNLSGIRVTSIPMEEIVFWFLAGLVFGPFYEYWQGERLRRIAA